MQLAPLVQPSCVADQEIHATSMEFQSSLIYRVYLLIGVVRDRNEISECGSGAALFKEATPSPVKTSAWTARALLPEGNKKKRGEYRRRAAR